MNVSEKTMVISKLFITKIMLGKNRTESQVASFPALSHFYKKHHGKSPPFLKLSPLVFKKCWFPIPHSRDSPPECTVQQAFPIPANNTTMSNSKTLQAPVSSPCLPPYLGSALFMALQPRCPHLCPLNIPSSLISKLLHLLFLLLKTFFPSLKYSCNLLIFVLVQMSPFRESSFKNLILTTSSW